MAYEIATATGAVNLFDRLISFLTTNGDLVAAGQAWEVLYDYTVPATINTLTHRRVMLRAPGLTGDDEIFIGLANYTSKAGDYYNIQTFGATGFNLPNVVGNDPRTGAVNPSPWTQLLGWDQPMPYWLIANGRRFFMACKVSTVYESLGAGFLLPNVPPSQYPYPLMVTGTYRGDTAVRWSSTEERHRSIVSPYELSTFIRDRNGVWGSFCADAAPASNGEGYQYRHIFPLALYRFDSLGSQLLGTMRDTNGTFPLVPITVATNGPQGTKVMGEFDGVFWTCAQNSGAEDIIQRDGYDHVVFQRHAISGNPWLFVLRMD